MRAYSTSDIPLENLQRFSAELRPDFDIQVDERQMFCKGGVPPSWVVFFTNADWLIKLLGLCAGLNVAEIVKEAGKDTWKNRKKIASTLTTLTFRSSKTAIRSKRGTNHLLKA